MYFFFSRRRFSHDHSFMPDRIRKTVTVQPLNLADYIYGDLYDRVNQIVDPNNPLLDIDEAYFRALA